MGDAEERLQVGGRMCPCGSGIGYRVATHRHIQWLFVILGNTVAARTAPGASFSKSIVQAEVFHVSRLYTIFSPLTRIAHSVVVAELGKMDTEHVAINSRITTA